MPHCILVGHQIALVVVCQICSAVHHRTSPLGVKIIWTGLQAIEIYCIFGSVGRVVDVSVLQHSSPRMVSVRSGFVVFLCQCSRCG